MQELPPISPKLMLEMFNLVPLLRNGDFVIVEPPLQLVVLGHPLFAFALPLVGHVVGLCQFSRQVVNVGAGDALVLSRLPLEDLDPPLELLDVLVVRGRGSPEATILISEIIIVQGQVLVGHAQAFGL